MSVACTLDVIDPRSGPLFRRFSPLYSDSPLAVGRLSTDNARHVFALSIADEELQDEASVSQY